MKKEKMTMGMLIAKICIFCFFTIVSIITTLSAIILIIMLLIFWLKAIFSGRPRHDYIILPF